MAVELRTIVQRLEIEDRTAGPLQQAAGNLDRFADEADQAAAATQRTANGLGALDRAMVVSTRSQGNAQRALDRWKAAADPMERTLQRMAQAERDLNRAVTQGLATDQQKVQLLGQLQSRLTGASTANDNFVRSQGQVATSSRGMGFAIQNAGYQVGDFAVQVASGQGVLRPFIQQGTQLVSMFGPLGAVIGAVGAIIGALAVGLDVFGDSTSEAADAMERLDNAITNANTILSEHQRLGADIHAGRQTEITDLANLARNYLSLTETVRAYEQTRLQAARTDIMVEQAAIGRQTAVASQNIRRLAERVNAPASGVFAAMEAAGIEPGGAEMADARAGLEALTQAFADFNVAGTDSLEGMQQFYAALGDLVFDGGPLSAEVMDRTTAGSARAIQDLNDIAMGALTQLQHPTQMAGMLIAQLEAVNQGLDLMAMSPAELQALVDSMGNVATAAGGAASATGSAADEMRRLVDQAARRELRLDDYIAGLDETNRLEQLSTQEKAVQEAILRAQAILVDDQGQAVRSLTAAEQARIENAIRTRDLILEQRQATEAVEKAITATTDEVVDYASKPFAEIDAEILTDPVVQAEIAAEIKGALAL